MKIEAEDRTRSNFVESLGKSKLKDDDWIVFPSSHVLKKVSGLKCHT